MASKVEIVNLALSHLAQGKEIANLETEKSEEASAARRFYDIVRDQILRDFPWPFAKRIVALGLVAENPNSEWAFSYRYPTDCLKARRILSGTRNDTLLSRIKYKITGDASGWLIYTDKEEAELEYIAKNDNPQFYPPDFTLAFSYLLAAFMAPRIAGGDAFGLGKNAATLYMITLSQAAAAALNEEQTDSQPEAESITARL